MEPLLPATEDTNTIVPSFFSQHGLAQHLAGTQELAPQVDRLNAVPHFGVHFPNWSHLAYPGVVHQDMDLTEGFYGLLDRVDDVLLLSQIGSDR